jgi:hypothetical protein
MNCPSCKNSIDVNSQVCEWCGCKLKEETQIHSFGYKFEKEILDLVLAGKRKKAIKLFSKYTFQDLNKSEQEVNRLIVESGLSIIEIEKIEKEHLLIIVYSVFGALLLFVFWLCFLEYDLYSKKYVGVDDNGSSIYQDKIDFWGLLGLMILCLLMLFSFRKSYQLFLKLKIKNS